MPTATADDGGARVLCPDCGRQVKRLDDRAGHSIGCDVPYTVQEDLDYDEW
jgi:hypothetical protein